MSDKNQLTEAQRLINLWGQRKYPKFPDATFRFETETRDDGYCETCSSPYSVVVIYARPVNGREEEVGELRDVYIHDVLSDILSTKEGD